MKTIIPSAPEVVREAVILIGGAILAAIILAQIPALRDYINRNTKGCDCGNT